MLEDDEIVNGLYMELFQAVNARNTREARRKAEKLLGKYFIRQDDPAYWGFKTKAKKPKFFTSYYRIFPKLAKSSYTVKAICITFPNKLSGNELGTASVTEIPADDFIPSQRGGLIKVKEISKKRFMAMYRKFQKRFDKYLEVL